MVESAIFNRMHRAASLQPYHSSPIFGRLRINSSAPSPRRIFFHQHPVSMREFHQPTGEISLSGQPGPHVHQSVAFLPKVSGALRGRTQSPGFLKSRAGLPLSDKSWDHAARPRCTSVCPDYFQACRIVACCIRPEHGTVVPATRLASSRDRLRTWPLYFFLSPIANIIPVCLSLPT